MKRPSHEALDADWEPGRVVVRLRSSQQRFGRWRHMSLPAVRLMALVSAAISVAALVASPSRDTLQLAAFLLVLGALTWIPPARQELEITSGRLRYRVVGLGPLSRLVPSPTLGLAGLALRRTERSLTLLDGDAEVATFTATPAEVEALAPLLLRAIADAPTDERAHVPSEIGRIQRAGRAGRGAQLDVWSARGALWVEARPFPFAPPWGGPPGPLVLVALVSWLFLFERLGSWLVSRGPLVAVAGCAALVVATLATATFLLRCLRLEIRPDRILAHPHPLYALIARPFGLRPVEIRRAEVARITHVDGALRLLDADDRLLLRLGGLPPEALARLERLLD